MKQNLHIHSCYCDGKNPPAEMIEAAMKAGYDSIGFSGHSYMAYSPKNGMSLENEKIYKQEVRRLQDVYKGSFDVFCGIEYDMYSDIDISDYDYAIGSVHYLLLDGKYVGFDRSAQEVKRVIDTYFDGDGLKYAKAYYETLCALPQYGQFDIIGHLDLVSKHCENADFLDVNSDTYLHYAFEAIDALKGKIPFFEINTGAIARAYRTTPYPSVPIMKRLKEAGFGAVITTDCHDASMVNCYYDESVELLKSCGFTYKFVLTDKGFIPDAL